MGHFLRRAAGAPREGRGSLPHPTPLADRLRHSGGSRNPRLALTTTLRARVAVPVTEVGRPLVAHLQPPPALDSGFRRNDVVVAVSGSRDRVWGGLRRFSTTPHPFSRSPPSFRRKPESTAWEALHGPVRPPARATGRSPLRRRGSVRLLRIGARQVVGVRLAWRPGWSVSHCPPFSRPSIHKLPPRLGPGAGQELGLPGVEGFLGLGVFTGKVFAEARQG